MARPRWLVLCALGAAVAGLHWVALVMLGPAWLDPEGPASPVPVARIELRGVAAPGPGATAPTPDVAAALAASPTLAPRVDVPRVRAALPTAVATSAAKDRPGPAIAVAVAASDATLDSSAEWAGLSAPVSASEVPVYATRLPAAGQWRYRLQRGPMVGEAELNWAPQGGARYELLLQGRVAGVTLLEWASQGQLDAAGVAPERLAIRRRGRDRQAVNFQREASKITFSGPTHELLLLPGAQDRLSWMVQLPAVVAAAPERFAAGASVVLFVAGARGDADIWTFVVQGVELLGDRQTLKLVREPRRRYDTRAEVWLDPTEQYMPLRVVQTPSGGGAALELQRDRETR